MAGSSRETAPAGDVEAAVETILDDLRADGGRATSGRRAIIRSLITASNHHVTADELVARVQTDHPDVHRSTVYRTLDSLEDLGVIHRIALGSGGAVFHLVDRAHHHVVCTECGSVLEVSATTLAPALTRIEADTGYAVDGGHVVVSGICPTCRARHRSS